MTTYILKQLAEFSSLTNLNDLRQSLLLKYLKPYKKTEEALDFMNEIPLKMLAISIFTRQRKTLKYAK